MSKQEYTPKRRWRIECTEEKLRLIANSVEDITRFIGGQPQMMYCLSLFDHSNEIGEYMRQNVRPMARHGLCRQPTERISMQIPIFHFASRFVPHRLWLTPRSGCAKKRALTCLCGTALVATAGKYQRPILNHAAQRLWFMTITARIRTAVCG